MRTLKFKIEIDSYALEFPNSWGFSFVFAIDDMKDYLTFKMNINIPSPKSQEMETNWKFIQFILENSFELKASSNTASFFMWILLAFKELLDSINSR